MLVRRGEIWFANLGQTSGSVQGGYRPVLIIQNDIGNKFSPCTQVVPITSKNKRLLPTHFDLSGCDCGLPKNSIALMEQSTTIDKSQLIDKVGFVSLDNMQKIEDCIMISYGIPLSRKYNCATVS